MAGKNHFMHYIYLLNIYHYYSVSRQYIFKQLFIGFIFIFLLICSFVIAHGQVIWSPPPEPDIPPIVSKPVELDSDQSKIDDRIEQKYHESINLLHKKDISTQLRQTALDTLESSIPVELIFNQQITQAQIDSFISQGGTIRYIFTHVSYGWLGEIPLKNIIFLPDKLGKSFLGIIERKPIQRHLDQAGRTGRVRPMVWNAGFSGNSTITIAILDSGIDGTHSDLTGRQAYWKDWTKDAHLTAQDVGHHGTHVAGIALGSGIASGINPTTLSFMNLGNMPSISGSFFPSPFHVPTTISTISVWTSNMRWVAGGGVVAQIGHLNYNSTGSLALVGSLVTGSSSPLIKISNSIPNPIPNRTNRWSSFPSKSSGFGTPEYAVTNTISYTGLGDGYPVIRGVAPGSYWAGLKVFRDDGSGDANDISAALDDLVAKRTVYNIKIANLSLGIIGNPGIHTPIRNKVNTAALNGIVMSVSAGNDGTFGFDSTGIIDDPGRAHYAITVTSSSDINQLTDYSSHGFIGSGDTTDGQADTKPDIMAPGGSFRHSFIMAPDSNTSDSDTNTGANFTDAVPNNYLNILGTSMAAPFISGCAALVIDALQQNGHIWNFTGTEALADVLKVKMLLLMTATETNLPRESGPSGNPTLNRGGKDINEGFGMINADAAVDAAAGLIYNGGPISDWFGSGHSDKRCWARKVNLFNGQPLNLGLNVPSTGDFDIYLYRFTPDAFGNPVILSSSINTGLDTNESLYYIPDFNGPAYLVVKRVAGSGLWELDGYVPVELSEFIIEQ